MTENNRKEIINTINKQIQEKEALPTKYEELKKLNTDPKIIKYLELIKEIDKIETELKKYTNSTTKNLDTSTENIINHNFENNNNSCEHNIWIYTGSSYSSKYPNKYLKDYLEELKHGIYKTYKFSHNEYECLECKKRITISKIDWENFENSHFILKIHDHINIEYYRDLYYQLLYNNYDFEESRQIIIDEFNKNNYTYIKKIKNI